MQNRKGQEERRRKEHEKRRKKEIKTRMYKGREKI
jgi:hypothetical protein